MQQRYKIVTLLFLLTSISVKGQKDAYSSDDNSSDLYTLKMKFVADYYNFKSIANTLHFSYNPSSNIAIKKDIDLSGAGRLFSLGIGMEKDYENHLHLDLAKVTFGGLINQTANVNLSSGIGYLIAVGDEKKLLLRPDISVFYSVLSNEFGTFNDSTKTGVIVNNKNIGSFVSMSYKGYLLGITPNLNLVFKRPKVTFFINIGANIMIHEKEKIQFSYGRKDLYSQYIDPNNSNCLTNNDGAVSDKHIISAGRCFISVGFLIPFPPK